MSKTAVKLFSAARSGNLLQLKSTLPSGKRKRVNALSCKDQNGSLLHIAVVNSRLNIASFLVDKKIPIDSLNQRKQTPLHLAIMSENFDMLKFLVEEGSDIDLQDIEGCTPLILATIHQNFNMVQYLVKNRATLDILDLNHKSALHHAVRHKKLKLVEFLIESGVSIDIQDSKGLTALHYAVQAESFEIIKSLLAFGANFEIADKEGKVAKDLATKKIFIELFEKWESQEMESTSDEEEEEDGISSTQSKSKSSKSSSNHSTPNGKKRKIISMGDLEESSLEASPTKPSQAVPTPGLPKLLKESDTYLHAKNGGPSSKNLPKEVKQSLKRRKELDEYRMKLKEKLRRPNSPGDKEQKNEEGKKKLAKILERIKRKKPEKNVKKKRESKADKKIEMEMVEEEMEMGSEQLVNISSISDEIDIDANSDSSSSSSDERKKYYEKRDLNRVSGRSSLGESKDDRIRKLESENTEVRKLLDGGIAKVIEKLDSLSVKSSSSQLKIEKFRGVVEEVVAKKVDGLSREKERLVEIEGLRKENESLRKINSSVIEERELMKVELEKMKEKMESLKKTLRGHFQGILKVLE